MSFSPRMDERERVAFQNRFNIAAAAFIHILIKYVFAFGLRHDSQSQFMCNDIDDTIEQNWFSRSIHSFPYKNHNAGST